MLMIYGKAIKKEGELVGDVNFHPAIMQLEKSGNYLYLVN